MHARVCGRAPNRMRGVVGSVMEGAASRCLFRFVVLAAKHATHGSGDCRRDYRKARSDRRLMRADMSATSSSYRNASASTPNTSPTSGQAGDATSFPCEHGRIKGTGPIATWIGCLSSSEKTSNIAALFPSTSWVIRSWSDTKPPRTKAYGRTGQFRLTAIATSTKEPSQFPEQVRAA